MPVHSCDSSGQFQLPPVNECTLFSWASRAKLALTNSKHGNLWAMVVQKCKQGLDMWTEFSGAYLAEQSLAQIASKVAEDGHRPPSSLFAYLGFL